jgi:hypothetical protein
VQDDAVPVPNFVPAIQSVAVSWPDTPVCLFLYRVPQGTAALARRAMMKGGIRYVPLHPTSAFVPIVAVLWPVERARAFSEWADSGVVLPGHPSPRADDSVLAKWMKGVPKSRGRGQVQRNTFMVTVPSLVDHLDVPSVKGMRTVEGWKALFLASDAADYEW